MSEYQSLQTDLEALKRYISPAEQRPFCHKIHDYPARFLPQIPAALIKNLTKGGDLIVDPMCGCGTSLEVASQMQRRALGFDLSPISALILGSLDLSQIPSQNFIEKFILELSTDFANGLASSPKLPDKNQFHNWRLWYLPEVLKELFFIRDKITALGSSQNFLKLALSRICKDLSNADSRDLFPQRDRQNPIKERQDTLKHFSKSVLSLYEDLKNVDFDKINFVRANASALPIKNKIADLVLFSPPYSYALEYVRVHQLSLSVLGYERKHLREHRRLYVGTDKVKTKLNLPDDFLQKYADVIDPAIDKDQKWGRFFAFYLFGMQKIIFESARILKPNAHLALVVGNTKLRGSKLNLDQIFSLICSENNLEQKLVFERPYYRHRLNPNRNKHSSKIEADLILVFKKDNRI